MSKLVLIDGNAILHRAFHALPPLTSTDGQQANAVYGFFSMFLRIIDETKPDYIVTCFDRPKPTFRKELYVEYQAHRPKMDDNLVPQIGIVHEVLEKMKVQIFELDGYEADDVIGTLAKQACQVQSSKFKVQSLETIIVSGDRDLLQLVNSHVKMLSPVTGITNMLLFDEEKVEEKYSIKPKQIIDYKALIGDASDNYPGVLGVGPKTAVGLLKEYETLENIYKNLDSIKQKNENLAVKLKSGEDQAEMAKKLATIVTDVPVDFDLEKCAVSGFDMDGLKKSFEELGFKSLIKRLEGESVRPQEPKKEEKKKEGEQLGLL
ncbi:MAG: 5'-3' exonuclease H3TH domain-containing protein [Candidatus Levybacteria bacterium]|nr:5'-3' exonuclease H3TH domain-containing protein [Candidatus Levybacteria bacterium]